MQLLKNGAKVWVSSRDNNKLNEFKNGLPTELQLNVGLINSQLSTESDAIKIRDQILSTDGKVTNVFSALGGWWDKGVLSDQSLEEFNNVMNDMITSHFIVYKTFAKELANQPNSSYTFISGGSIEEMLVYFLIYVLAFNNILKFF